MKEKYAMDNARNEGQEGKNYAWWCGVAVSDCGKGVKRRSRRGLEQHHNGPVPGTGPLIKWPCGPYLDAGLAWPLAAGHLPGKFIREPGNLVT
jgi:hypothetical protein